LCRSTPQRQIFDLFEVHTSLSKKADPGYAKGVAECLSASWPPWGVVLRLEWGQQPS